MAILRLYSEEIRDWEDKQNWLTESWKKGKMWGEKQGLVLLWTMEVQNRGCEIYKHLDEGRGRD